MDGRPGRRPWPAIEDGSAGRLPGRHARPASEDDNPAGSILMGLNDGWADQFMEERGATVEQIAAAAVKACRHAARNPLGPVPAGGDASTRSSARHRWPASSPGSCAARSPTGRPRSSWRARASGRPPGAPYHRLGGPLGQRTDRLPRSPDRGRRRGLGGLRDRARRLRHRRAARRHAAPRSSSPSSHSGSSGPARRDRPPLAGRHRHRRPRG